MSRKTARRNAFELVFQMGFYDASELNRVLDGFFARSKKNSDDEGYITEVVNGVFDNLAEIDGHIERRSEKWSADRIAKVDMAIMRVCVYEMLKMEKIPINVSLNEAVELAKLFGTEESPVFINGVLSAISKEIKDNA